jgi:hypothetical protein
MNEPIALFLLSDGRGARYAIPLHALEPYRLPDGVDNEVAALFDGQGGEDVSGYGGGRSPRAGLLYSSGAEVSMIQLQSLVAKRATALQLTTGLLQSLNDGTHTIAGNIGY